MKNREKQPNNIPWEMELYQTGSTMPPKDRGGHLAILLVTVLLIGSMGSLFGLFDPNFIDQLPHEEDPGTLNVFDSTPEDTVPKSLGESADSIPFLRMGIEGQTVSDFDRRFYELPQGVLVTDVTKNAWSHEAGIHSGDVITALNGQTITCQEDLQTLLETCPAGTPIAVEFYRYQSGRQLSAHITLPTP